MTHDSILSAIRVTLKSPSPSTGFSSGSTPNILSRTPTFTSPLAGYRWTSLGLDIFRVSRALTSDLLVVRPAANMSRKTKVRFMGHIRSAHSDTVIHLPAANLQRFFERAGGNAWFPSSAPSAAINLTTSDDHTISETLRTETSAGADAILLIRAQLPLPTSSPILTSTTSVSPSPPSQNLTVHSSSAPQLSLPEKDDQPNSRNRKRPRTSSFTYHAGNSNASENGDRSQATSDSISGPDCDWLEHDEVEVKPVVVLEEDLPRTSMTRVAGACPEDGRLIFEKTRDLLAIAKQKKKEWEEAEALARAALLAEEQPLSPDPIQTTYHAERTEDENEELNVEEEQFL